MSWTVDNWTWNGKEMKMSGKEVVIFKNILLDKQYRDVKVEVVFRLSGLFW